MATTESEIVADTSRRLADAERSGPEQRRSSPPVTSDARRAAEADSAGCVGAVAPVVAGKP